MLFDTKRTGEPVRRERERDKEREKVIYTRCHFQSGHHRLTSAPRRARTFLSGSDLEYRAGPPSLHALLARVKCARARESSIARDIRRKADTLYLEYIAAGQAFHERATSHPPVDKTRRDFSSGQIKSARFTVSPKKHRGIVRATPRRL